MSGKKEWLKIMRQSNNKILFSVLVILAGGFVLTRVFRAPSRERNIDETILSLDTSKVSAIHISPATQNKKEIKLVRAGKDWRVETEKQTARPEKRQVQNALASLTEVNAERVLTRNEEKWASYHVDSSGTFVKVLLDQDAKEFWLGNGGVSSIRLEGESDVYEIQQNLERNFNKTFHEWRDRTFLKAETDNILKVTFQYPGDSSYVLANSGSRWEIDNLVVDTIKVQTYLNRFKSRSLPEFADDFTPQRQPAFTVTLQSGKANVTTVQAWKEEDDRWILNSSQRADVYFSSRDSSFIRDLFVPKTWFISN